MRSVFFSLWLALGTVVPGWLLGRVLRARAGLAGAVIGSAVLVMYVLVALDLCHVPLTAGNVSLALTVVCGLLAAADWWLMSPPPSAAPQPFNWVWRRHHWFLVSVFVALAGMVWRVLADPLPGADTGFRWSFLAEQMLRTARLDFYPPVSAEDYHVYAWCDGIAPLVSCLYFLSYAGLGKVAAWATTPVVLLQIAALYGAVYEVARRRGNAAGGWCAVGVLGTSFVLNYGVVIGQETAITALTLIAMLGFIDRHRQDPKTAWLVWAGIAAGAGGLAREYGLVYPALGALALGIPRVLKRDGLILIGTAIVVVAPWYGLNWIRTGNPVYSYDVLGWFPTNQIYLDYLRAVTELIGLRTHPGAIMMLLGLVAVLAGVPLLLALLGSVRLGRAVSPWAVTVLILIGIWSWTAGQTSGGYVYSLRVLTPAVALAAVVAGWGWSAWARSRYSLIGALLCTIATIDATARLFSTPPDPTVAWWRNTTSHWQTERDAARAWHASPQWAMIAGIATGEKVLCTDPSDYADISRQGGRPVALFSPEVEFVFSPDGIFGEQVAELQRRQIRLLVVSRENPVWDRHLGRYPFFRALRSEKPAMSTALYHLYDTERLARHEVSTAPSLPTLTDPPGKNLK